MSLVEDYSAWREIWAYFGLDFVPDFEHMSASSIVREGWGKEDTRSADYIFGWYMYLRNSIETYPDEPPMFEKIVSDPEFKERSPDKWHGWLDAKSYYEEHWEDMFIDMAPEDRKIYECLGIV